jgi:DNA-binding NarL/FixJ family response regulator
VTGTRKRVLLIISGKFLGGVIHNLFSGCDQLSVSTAKPTSGRKLLDEVRTQQPEIVVIDDTLGMEYLANLMVYMQNGVNIRVVVLNTESNQVQIFQKHEIKLTQPEDLFAIL